MEFKIKMLEIDEDPDLKKQTEERNKFRASLIEEEKIKESEVRSITILSKW